MRDRPNPNFKLEWPGGVVPEWARPQQKPNRQRRGGKGGGPGGQHERGPRGAQGKRERLQKVMAQSGYGSRRNIEILIAQGHITVNGQVAKLGDSVGPGDKVKLDGNLIQLRFGEQLPRVLIYNKPDNEIVTRDDPEKRATVFDRLPKVQGGRWVSVGRLDLNTSGLLMFTTSGELANRLTHPRFEVEREYAVRLMGELTEEQIEKLTKTGIDVDGEIAKFDSLEDRGGEGSNHWYHVVLREGKNREVRRMMEAAGMMVSRLIRVRFGNVTLPGHIKRGMFRDMEEEQVQELLAFAGMNEPEGGTPAGEEEEDEDDNIGNRVGPARAQPEFDEPDDDIGNRAPPQREFDGNRGQPGAAGNRPPKPGGARRPQGQGHGHGHGHAHGKPTGFKKRGQGQGQGKAQPHQGHAGAQGQGQPQGQGQGQPHQGQPHPGQGQGPGKPGRNRRNRNRNRNRGGGGAPGAGGTGGPPPIPSV